MKKIMIGILIGTMVSTTFSAVRPKIGYSNTFLTAKAILYVGDCIKDNTEAIKHLAYTIKEEK